MPPIKSPMGAISTSPSRFTIRRNSIPRLRSFHPRFGHAERNIVASAWTSPNQRAQSPFLHRTRLSFDHANQPFGRDAVGDSRTHRFCQLAGHGSNDGVACQGEARFLHILEEREQRWVITRVVSYDHRAAK
jgi:hypothetical protein